MSLRCRWIVAVALAGLLAGGCSATPLPEPPAETLDFGLIHGPEMEPASTYFTIIGEPGAGPPGHALRVTNLDTVDDPIDAVIADDGSFALQVSGEQGDELRFHTRQGRTRAAPIDVVWNPRQLVEPARVECLRLVPLQQQDFGVVAVGAEPVAHAVSLDNDCDDAVQVTAARLRQSSVDFAVGGATPELPADVAPGDGLSRILELSPTEPGDAEQIFFLELTYAASAVRYPITLFGDGR